MKTFITHSLSNAGSPSGHAMGAAGVYYALVTSILAIALSKEKKSSSSKSLYLRSSLWTIFWTVQVCVCLSRVFIAAHFPHQVIAGVITGMIVAEAFNRQQWIYSASLKQYFNTTLFLLSFAVGFYVLLKILGVDLLWTLEKAQKWCINPAWVHMDSTPFASLLRNMGTLFGLGLGLHLSCHSESKRNNNSALFRSGCICISLVLLQLLDSVTFSSNNHLLFYFLSFCKSAAALVLPTALVPAAMSWILYRGKHEKDI